MSPIAHKDVPIPSAAAISDLLPSILQRWVCPTRPARMLQNHSRCRNGRGGGQHRPGADSPRWRGRGTSSEQDSVNDSEEDRRFLADFEGQSVFDWEEISVLSMYEDNYERPWLQHLVDSLGGEEVFSHQTEAWVASAAKRRQDPDEEYRDEPHYGDPGRRRDARKGCECCLRRCAGATPRRAGPCTSRWRRWSWRTEKLSCRSCGRNWGGPRRNRPGRRGAAWQRRCRGTRI